MTAFDLTWRHEETHDPTWQHDETQFPQLQSPVREPNSTPVPGLTILSHPEISRIGETAILSELLGGGSMGLSRLEPHFSQPSTVALRPLQSNCVSRRPLRLRYDPEVEELTIERQRNQASLVLQGTAVADSVTLGEQEIRQGVPLILNEQVLLWLHYIQPGLYGNFPNHGMIGESPSMLRLRAEIDRAAETQVPVLLRGETGTGKELAARALHLAGCRRDEPFVAVNMAAVPPSLAASELFGAVRGAYTGANRQKTGLFRRAHGGTLFLDEIGDTSPEVQVLLLRALERQEIQPVGSTETIKVNVRVIAATDADLEHEIDSGRFRKPLYHRLAGYQIRLPALRERRDDLGRLFYAFAKEELGARVWAKVLSNGGKAWPPAKVMARLLDYHWPGNVRELRNVARRFAIARSTEPITSDMLNLLDELLETRPNLPVSGDKHALHTSAQGPDQGPESPPPEPVINTADEQDGLFRRRRFRKITEVSEHELITALRDHRWAIKPTAAALRVSRAGLYRLIEQCSGIRKAAELGRGEIEEALLACDGNAEAAAVLLEVSPAGLKLRLKSLRIAC